MSYLYVRHIVCFFIAISAFALVAPCRLSSPHTFLIAITTAFHSKPAVIECRLALCTYPGFIPAYKMSQVAIPNPVWQIVNRKSQIVKNSKSIIKKNRK